MRRANPNFGIAQKAEGCAEGPLNRTLNTAERIRIAVPVVIANASHPATSLLRETSSVSTAPAMQVRSETRTACSGVSIGSFLRVLRLKQQLKEHAQRSANGRGKVLSFLK